MSDFNNGNTGESEYVEKFLADLRNRINGTALPGSQKAPQLYPDWYENNLSFVVKTNVPEDEGNSHGKLRFGGDNQTSALALVLLVGMIEGHEWANMGKGPLETHYFTFTSTTGFGENEERSRITVGRKEGRYFITIIEKDRPQPVFFFGPSRFHGMFINGKPANDVECSKFYALSWATNIINAIPTLQSAYYEKVGDLIDKWAKKKGGANGGFKGKQNNYKQNNYKQNNYKQNNYKQNDYKQNNYKQNNYKKPNNYTPPPAKPTPDFDNEIPF